MFYFESKFYQNVIIYTCNQDKINYLRNHCKKIAFGIIRAKANSTFANSYLIASKIIQDLENIFGKFNKVLKLDAVLYDFKIIIAIAKPKKTFNKFFVEFISAIILFDFTD